MAVLSDVPPDRDADWNDRKLSVAARFVEGVEGLLRAEADTGGLDAAHVASTVAKAAANLDNALRRGRINTALAAARAIVGQAGKQTANAALDASAHTYIASLLYSLLPTSAGEALGGAATPPAWPNLPQPSQETSLVELVVQINGKKRGNVKVAADAGEAAVLAAVRADGPLQALLGDATPRKTIVVPGRLVNIVLWPSPPALTGSCRSAVVRCMTDAAFGLPVCDYVTGERALWGCHRRRPEAIHGPVLVHRALR